MFGLAYGNLASTVQKVGTDDTGLGRWSWMCLQGWDGHVAQIAVVYMPCLSMETQVGMVYQQHQQYLDSVGWCQENPRQVLHSNPVRALCNWRQWGKCLILFIDAMMNGELNLLLMNGELSMREAVQAHHPSLPATPTFHSGGRLGRRPIDVVYITLDIPIKAGTWMLVKKCPGDHRFCIIDVRWKALVGEDLCKIARPQACQLNSQILKAHVKYEELLQMNVKCHGIVRKLHNIYTACSDSLTHSQQTQMNSIDRVKQELMLHAE